MTQQVDEKLLALSNTARLATVVSGHMAPLFRAQRERVLATMKLDYRAGKFDHIKMQGLVAELIVLENLENELRSQISRAGAALDKTEKL